MSKNPLIRIVVAVSENGVIGSDNRLIWHLPADLKRFKEVTTGFPVIMGRKTFESIGRVLPNRRNIVISRKSGLVITGADVVRSPEDALDLCGSEDRISIIGGGEIYRYFMPLAHEIFLTRVHHDFAGDTYFPAPGAEWECVESTLCAPDEKNEYGFTFQRWVRK
jgi:dihydrofolate reductase